jgi:GT2 family glycosyltransferase
MESPRMARATIVMTARERHSLAATALESIVKHTARPYRLMYVDCASPEWLRDVLDARAAEWGLDVVRFDQPLWPQQARHRVIDRIASDYTVFIDNDVLVEPGWLEALVACADETGAGIVAPLYLWGDGIRPPKVHMAGGKIVESIVPDGRVLEELHQFADVDPRSVQLQRVPCDFAEYHCMLIRTSLLREYGVLDPAIRCVHEHIDIALEVRSRHHPVYIEPAARVTYLASAECKLTELKFWRERWAPAEANASIAAFCRKWGVVDDERSFGGVRRFVRDHVAMVDPVRAEARAGPDTPMQKQEHRETRSGLMDLALERGYREAELATLASSYRIAQALVDGGYRPCGRPFIDHLVGTASVLVRYGFQADVVAAGLLHAAYTHAPRGVGSRAAEAIGEILGGRDSALETRVRAYTQRESTHGDAPSIELARASLLDAEVVAMVAANEIDLHLSGELRYSGRTDIVGPTRLDEIRQVCSILGVSGMFETLRQARANLEPVPPALMTRAPASYRIGADRRSLIPMGNNVLRAAVSVPHLSARSTGHFRMSPLDAGLNRNDR